MEPVEISQNTELVVYMVFQINFPQKATKFTKKVLWFCGKFLVTGCFSETINPENHRIHRRFRGSLFPTINYSLMAACAAAKRAIGTRKS